MRLALLFVVLAAPVAAQDAVGARIAQSAAAAEQWQGPLDGAWRLVDAAGGTLAFIEVGDPQDDGVLSCAWRAPPGPPRAAVCRRAGRRLIVAVDGERAVLTRDRIGGWRGRITGRGPPRTVTLRRP